MKAFIQMLLLVLWSSDPRAAVGFFLVRSRKGQLNRPIPPHDKPLSVFTSRSSQSPLLVLRPPELPRWSMQSGVPTTRLEIMPSFGVDRTFTGCDEVNDKMMMLFSVPREIQSDATTSSSSSSISSWIREFMYGVEYVHTQYLPILWKYSIVKSFAITLPFTILLWASHLYSPTLGSVIYTFIFRILHTMLLVSSWAAQLLHLPLTVMKWMLTALPGTIILFLDYLPDVVAVHLVKILLFVKDTVHVATGTTTRTALTANTSIAGGASQYYQHEVVTFLPSILAILVWHPAIEEVQYRSILNKFLFAPTVIQNLSTTIRSSAIYTATRSLLRGKRTPQSRYISNSPSKTMVEFIPLSELEEDQHQEQLRSTADVDNVMVSTSDDVDGSNNNGTGSKSFLPLPTESTRMVLGSLLFATTRLGWLSSDPASDDLYLSPYGWTIGFLQSMLTHFSSHVMVETRPSVRIWIVLLAIHQTVSTYLVSQHVFAQLYTQRGLPAAVGAHITWTISKGTVVFRLLWRLWLALYNRASRLYKVNR